MDFGDGIHVVARHSLNTFLIDVVEKNIIWTLIFGTLLSKSFAVIVKKMKNCAIYKTLWSQKLSVFRSSTFESRINESMDYLDYLEKNVPKVIANIGDPF